MHPALEQIQAAMKPFGRVKLSVMGTIPVPKPWSLGFALGLQERQVLWAERRVKICSGLLFGIQESSARLFFYYYFLFHFLTALAQERNFIKALALENAQL